MSFERDIFLKARYNHHYFIAVLYCLLKIKLRKRYAITHCYHMSHTMLRHIPNLLTLIRLLLIAPFLIFIYQQAYRYAFYAFVVAGFTDGLDGWLARSFDWQSSFGSFVDPVADKLLIASSFVSLAMLGCIPWWLVALVFLRDLTISLVVLNWHRFLAYKPDFKPSYLSKINTVLQLTLVTFFLFQLAFSSINATVLSLLTALTALTTLSSYIDYAWTWGKKAWLNTRITK